MWFWFGENNIALELGRIFSLDLGFHFEVETEGILFAFYLFLIDFYINFDFKSITKWLQKHGNYHYKHTIYRGTPQEKVEEGSYWEKRSIRLSLDLRNKSLSGEWWTNMNNEPRGRHFYVFLDDFFFGRAKYSAETISEGDTVIEMPEGVYQATYKKFISSWRRPRSPFVKKITRIELDIPVGIPHEGKGENSWDMGMDATFGVTMPLEQGETIGEVTRRFAMSCLKERQKYGSLSGDAYSKWKTEGEARLASQKPI